MSDKPFAAMHAAHRDLQKMKWKWVRPTHKPVDARPWWKKLLGLDAPHQHHHEMTFPDIDKDPLGWLFVCKCGHTTTDIEEASP